MAYNTNTVLLLHGDGTDGSSTITDSESTPKTVTASGHAQIDTAQKVFGTGSILFDGTDDFLSIPDSADFSFGSGDFTIDFRIRFNALPSGAVYLYCHTNADYSKRFDFYYYKSGSDSYFDLNLNGNTGTLSGGVWNWSPSTGTWYHVALVRNATSFDVAVDGTFLTGGYTLSSGYSFVDVDASVYISTRQTENAYFLNGWLEEYRILKGEAAWTTDFTPPAAAYDDPVTSALKDLIGGTGFIPFPR